MEATLEHNKLTYSVPEAAAVLGVSTSNMYQIIKIQGFPVINIGKRRLIPVKGLEQWIEEQVAREWHQ